MHEQIDRSDQQTVQRSVSNQVFHFHHRAPKKQPGNRNRHLVNIKKQEQVKIVPPVNQLELLHEDPNGKIFGQFSYDIGRNRREKIESIFHQRERRCFQKCKHDGHGSSTTKHIELLFRFLPQDAIGCRQDDQPNKL